MQPQNRAKNTQKRAQLGEPVLILRACSALLSACSALLSACSAPPTGACSAPPTGACSAPPTSACSALFMGACSAPQKIPPPPPQPQRQTRGVVLRQDVPPDTRQPDREKTSGLGGYMPSTIKQNHATSCHAKIKQMSCHAKNRAKRGIPPVRI